jgi:hypothetical protein
MFVDQDETRVMKLIDGGGGRCARKEQKEMKLPTDDEYKEYNERWLCTSINIDERGR